MGIKGRDPHNPVSLFCSNLYIEIELRLYLSESKNISIEFVPRAADVAVVFVGTLSTEGADRVSLSLDDGGPRSNQNALIEAVAGAQAHNSIA